MRTVPRLVLACAVWLWACGGDVVVDSGRGGGGDGGAGGDQPSSTSVNSSVANSSVAVSSNVAVVSASAVTSSVSTGPSRDCFDLPLDECYMCLAEQNPQGFETLNQLFYGGCLCDNGAPCAPFCQDDQFCVNMGNIGVECQTCIDDVLNNGDPCVDAAIMSCLGDPACAQFFNDVQNCQ